MLTSRIINFFEKEKVDLIIVACGTVSSTILENIKKITNIPIIDIVSPTIEYVNSLDYQDVSVFATNKTIDSHIFKERLNKNVKEIATKEFVPMIENLKIDTGIIDNYLNQIRESEVLILGCTHYPILKKYIKNSLKNIKIIDMGEILSKKLSLDMNSKLEITLYFSKISSSLLKNIDNIIAFDYKIIEKELI